MNLLFIKLSALGDIFQTLPALFYLKRELPFVEIDWAIEKQNSEVLLNYPLLQKILIFEKAYLSNPFKALPFIKELRKKTYLACIDFQGLLKSAWICFFTKAKYKIGFSNHREGSPLFYNLKFKPYDLELHAVKRYLLLAEKVKNFLIHGNEIDIDSIPQIPRNIPISEKKPSFFNPLKPYIVLIASARWKTKLWPWSSWADFLRLSRELFNEYDFYFVGGKDPELERFAKGMAEKYNGVLSLVGKLSLLELVYVINRAKAVITVDTGPMHLASLLNKPILALFGPTSPHRTGPWSEKFLVLSEEVSCSPCFKRSCPQNICMSKIHPSKVFQGLKLLLANQNTHSLT